MNKQIELGWCCSSLSTILSVLLLSGCGGQPVKEDPIALHAQIVASGDANPDQNGRPSPVVVAIYQLTGVEVFQSGDFFAVFDSEGLALGDALLAREQVTVRPGDKKDFTAEFNPDAEFIGVVVAYRDVENAAWRISMKLQGKDLEEKTKFFKKRRLIIDVGPLAVSISDEQS
jgi:type VI secretion system protein VasD